MSAERWCYQRNFWVLKNNICKIKQKWLCKWCSLPAKELFREIELSDFGFDKKMNFSLDQLNLKIFSLSLVVQQLVMKSPKKNKTNFLKILNNFFLKHFLLKKISKKPFSLLLLCSQKNMTNCTIQKIFIFLWKLKIWTLKKYLKNYFIEFNSAKVEKVV